jgi:ankyrin repeat protein
MALSTRIALSRANLKKELRDFFIANQRDPREISALLKGYVREEAVIDLIFKWCEEEYKKFESRAIQEDKEWISKLYQAATNAYYAKDYSQNNLMARYVKFLETYPHPEHIRDKDRLIAKLQTAGHCNGFSYAVGCAYTLQRQPREKDASPRDDMDWLRSVFNDLIDWDQATPFSAEKAKNILASLRLITDTQYSNIKFSIPQGDWDKLFTDTKGRKFKTSESFVTSLKKGQGIRKILQMIASDSKDQDSKSDVNEEAEVELIPIDFKGHTTLIIKTTALKSKEVNYIYYDSNNRLGLMPPVKNVSSLYNVIRVAYSITNSEFQPICGRILGIGEKKYANSTDALLPPEELKKLDAAELTSLLHYATSVDSTSYVEHLLAHGADPGTRFDSGHTALHEAARWNRPDFIKRFAEHPTKKTHVDGLSINANLSALHVASRFGNDAAVAELIRQRANVNRKQSANAPKRKLWTPLILASHFGHENVVRRLLKAGANTEIINADNQVALDVAVAADHLDVVAALIEGGADLLRKVNGRSILHFAKSDAMRELLGPAMVKQATDKKCARISTSRGLSAGSRG